MGKFLLAIFTLVFSGVVLADNVTYSAADLSQGGLSPVTATKLDIQPRFPYEIVGTNIITRAPVKTQFTNGIVTVSNMVAGIYTNTIKGSGAVTIFLTEVAESGTDNDVDAVDLITLSTNAPGTSTAYSQTQSRARFVDKTNSWSYGQTLTNGTFKGTNTFTGLITLDGTNILDLLGEGGGISQSTLNATNAALLSAIQGTNTALITRINATNAALLSTLATQGTAQTNDTITRIGTNNTAIANTYATIADLQGESVDIISRIGDSNTVYRAEFARRGDFIPSGVTFWDDFEGTNTTTLSWLAPSINPRTGTNYVWYPNAATSQSFTNAYRTNGYLFSPDRASSTNSWAVYPSVDVGVKPSYFGARLKRVNTGYVSADTWVQFCFILSPTNNSIENAYHFAIFPESYVRCQYWSNNTLTDEIFDGGLTPAYNAGWVGHANNQDFVFQVWIDGTNITVDAGGWLFHTNDARLPDFGGRFLTAELFDSGGGVTNIWDVRVESIWAGENPLPPISHTASGSGLSPTNSPVDGYVPVATGSDTKWAAQSGSGSGETNTASNAGIGYHLFDQKISVDFQFNTFTNGTGLTVSSNANLFTLSLTGNAFNWHQLTTNLYYQIASNATAIAALGTNFYSGITISNVSGSHLDIDDSGTNIVLIFDPTGLGGGSVTTNLFTTTSSLDLAYTNGGSYTIIDTTNDLIGGFLHVYNRDVVADKQFDIIFHIDALPTASTLKPVSICQFQGAVGGDASVSLIGTHETNGHFRLKIYVANGTNSTVHLRGMYGLPEMSLTGTNEANLTYGVTFTAIHGQISANALQAKTFNLFDSAGATTTLATLSNPDDVGEGYTIGSPTLATINGFNLYVGGGGELTGALIVGDTLDVTGKLGAGGGVDPPYVLFDPNTRAAVKARVLLEVPLNKQAGVNVFRNQETRRMEYYIASEDKFYDLSSNTELSPPKQADVLMVRDALVKADATRKQAQSEKAKKQKLKEIFRGRK